jgi:hypothetical protein
VRKRIFELQWKQKTADEKLNERLAILGLTEKFNERVNFIYFIKKYIEVLDLLYLESHNFNKYDRNLISHFCTLIYTLESTKFVTFKYADNICFDFDNKLKKDFPKLFSLLTQLETLADKYKNDEI